VSVIADLVALAQGRYGPGVPATPKPGANAPALWLRPASPGGTAQTRRAAGTRSTKDLPTSPGTDQDPRPAPARRASPQAGPLSGPAPGDAGRVPAPAVPPQPGPATASTARPPPPDGSADAALARAQLAPPEPSRQPARPEPAPRQRPMLDVTAPRPSHGPLPLRAADPDAPDDQRPAEQEIVARERPRAVRPPEAPAPTQPSPSRSGPSMENEPAEHPPPAADGATPQRVPVRITIGRIDIKVTGAERATSDRPRSALSDAARLRRAGVRRL
jgi:hypothetical protein